MKAPLSGRLMAALALSHIDFLKPAERLVLFGRCADGEEVAALDQEALARRLGRDFRQAGWTGGLALEAAKKSAEFCSSRGIAMLTIEDADFPPLLREIAQPPFVLFRRGPLPDPSKACAAIVGTRKPSMAAFSKTKKIAAELAGLGIPVVSGLALGIDRAAHEGALAAKGMTIGVLGCGIDQVYPRSHIGLAQKMLSNGGCLLSEYPPGFEPMKFRFPERNRIISGLARSVLVAQAPESSGALITADFALDQGRDLFVLPEGMEGDAGLGCKKLREEGAALVESARDMIADWAL